MRAYLIAAMITIVVSLSLPTLAQGTKASDIEAQIRLDVTTYMAAQEYATVLAKIAAWRYLGATLPLEYVALEAKLSVEAGDLPRAKKCFDEYFARARTDHADYAESKRIYDGIQPRIAAAEAQRVITAAEAEKNRAADARNEKKRMAETKAVRARIERDIAKRMKFIKDCAGCPEVAAIPPGQFIMGKTDGSGKSDESPAHTVAIAKAFGIGRYEVTFAEWDACSAAGGCRIKPSDEGWGRGNLPVMNVTWHDAQEYVKWLSGKTGQRYRLPTEAEWEYAARAGTSADFNWGDGASHEYANYGTDECCAGLAMGTDRWVNTSPVGSFGPNAWGIYDALGNVREWVEDCAHDAGYAGAPADGSAWTTGCDGDLRVYRGGSYSVFPFLMRLPNRGRYAPDVTFKNLGFRVARDIP